MMYHLAVSAPYFLIKSSGLMTFFFDFAILADGMISTGSPVSFRTAPSGLISTSVGKW